MILTKYLMMLGLFILALFALNFVSGDASADTHVWISDDAGTFSDGTNWDLGSAPAAADACTWNSAHKGAATNDQILTYATMTFSATGQTVNGYVNCTGLTISGAYTLTFGGAWNVTSSYSGNSGQTIQGTGSLTFWQSAYAAENFGTINIPVEIVYASAGADYNGGYAGSNCVFGSSFTIRCKYDSSNYYWQGGSRTITVAGLTTIGKGVYWDCIGVCTFNGGLVINGNGAKFCQSGANVVVVDDCTIDINATVVPNNAYTWSISGDLISDVWSHSDATNKLTWVGIPDASTDFTVTSSMKNITWHDSPFSYTITANKGFTATMATDADWLSFNSTTNIASGTAITNGVYYCNITLTSDDGQVAFENTTITVMFPFSTEANSVFDIDNSEAAIYAELIFMIAMLFLQLYMVGRNKWIHLTAFMSLFIASIAMLTTWSTLYYVPFGFIMLSLLVFVFGMLRD